MTQPMEVVKWSMITLCFTIGIISQIASGALSGETRLNWGHLLARLVAVILFVHSAGSIQGFIWGSAEGIGNGLMPGPTLSDMNSGFMGKVQQMRSAQMQAAGTKQDMTLTSIMSDPKLVFNILADATMQAFEHISLTIFFLAFKALQSAQKVVMMFLAGMAPFILPASIIPGVDSWSSWLKMVISVSLWPVVAGFMIKGQYTTAAQWLGGAPSDSGAISGMFTADASNFFLNMDSLQLFAESIIYALMLFASPFLASALVYGGGNALAAGGAMLMTRPVMNLVTSSKEFVSQKLGPQGTFSGGGSGGSSRGPGMSSYSSSSRPRPSADASRSARYLPSTKGGSWRRHG